MAEIRIHRWKPYPEAWGAKVNGESLTDACYAPMVYSTPRDALRHASAVLKAVCPNELYLVLIC